MKRNPITKTAWALAVIFCLGAGMVWADTMLYQPNIVGNSNPNSLGHGGSDSAVQIHLSNSVWQAHYGASATLNPDVIDWDDGVVQGHVALLGRNGTSNPFRNQTALWWTENFAVTDVDVQDLSEIMYRRDNSDSLVVGVSRLAIRVGGDWFATAATENSTGQVTTTLTGAILASLDWYSLDFDPGNTMSLDTGSLVSFSSLSGNVDTAGLYYDTMGVNRVRLRGFTVAAIPEPAALGLVVVASGMLVFCRRFLII